MTALGPKMIRNAFTNASTVGASWLVNLICLRFFAVWHSSRAHLTWMSAHLSTGNPKMPLLIAGIATLSIRRESAARSAAFTCVQKTFAERETQIGHTQTHLTAPSSSSSSDSLAMKFGGTPVTKRAVHSLPRHACFVKSTKIRTGSPASGVNPGASFEYLNATFIWLLPLFATAMPSVPFHPSTLPSTSVSSPVRLLHTGPAT
mmetsp:Transcript_13738/g.28270  ORF Transcript_13738/g.28270 Transcript_13738/m.28270 type:complete len:204 (-) Transcript_13738:306-917(-)